MVMENFIISGKAKTVFQIIELMAKGEDTNKKQEALIDKTLFELSTST